MSKLVKFFIALLLFCVILMLAAYYAVQKDSPPSKQVFINANVLTMDPQNSVAQAIAIENKRIVAVGTNQQIKALIEQDTVIHDLKGKTLLPGFVDAHSHFPGLGMGQLTVDLNSPPIGDIESIQGIISRLKGEVGKIKDGKFLIGVGYDDSLLVEKRHVNRDDLDLVSKTKPVFLMHVSGHIVAVNSKALEIAGLNSESVAPKGGKYVRDETGRLTGVLEETARLKMLKLAFDLSFFDFINMVEQGSSEYAAAGVTTAQSGLTHEPQIQGYSLIDKLGLLPQRLVIWPDMAAGKRWANNEFDPQKFSTDNVKIGAVKLVADGSIQGFTGYLGQAYHSHAPAHGDEDYAGYPSMDQLKLNEAVLAMHQKGLQVAIHANGDAAIDMVINAVKNAQTQAPREDARHIVIHSQMATEKQLRQMKAWGLTPSFFTSHTYYWGDRHRDIFIGPERAKEISPAKSAVDIGLPFSFHLDTPVVPMSPLFAVYSGVNRVTSSGKVLGEHQRISVMQSLRSVTIDAAWQMFLDKEIGSIEVGKQADLVILDANPLDRPDSIDKINVLQTFVAGLSIFKR